MMKRLTVLALGGALLCLATIPAMAAEMKPDSISLPLTAEERVSMPDSVLYYGTVTEIVKDGDNKIDQLHLTSDHYGEYVMNLSDETVWIDSGNHAAADSSSLRIGENLYVFHSFAETRSLPPQSAAFAIVRNCPMDVGCAQYHEVESISQVNDQWKITTDQGTLLILTDEKTQRSRYGTDTPLAMNEIRPGDHVMAWYDAVATSEPGQTYAHHLMLLPGDGSSEGNDSLFTRAELVTMLHAQAGKPTADEAMDYTDVKDDGEYAEAVRWATSKKFVSGYGDGTFRPESPLSRQQFVTILWRYAGCPMLMDDPRLTQFTDAAEISSFARPAMAWAHQKGLISAVSGDLLDPQGPVTKELAELGLRTVTPKQ